MPKNKKRETDMVLNKKQIKNLIKAKQTLYNGFSEAALCTIIDTYKQNIKFDKNKHLFYMEYPFTIQSKVGYQDPVEKNVFHFVSLWVSSRHRCIFNQANTELEKRIFLYMEQLYNNQHR